MEHCGTARGIGESSPALCGRRHSRRRHFRLHAIAERHSSLGDEGLGHLSDLLSREFSRYMDVVAWHGGEMISFAGDALIACFLDRAGAKAVDLRATACARALTDMSGILLGVPAIASRSTSASASGAFGLRAWAAGSAAGNCSSAGRGANGVSAAAAAVPGRVIVQSSPGSSIDFDFRSESPIADEADLAWVYRTRPSARPRGPGARRLAQLRAPGHHCPVCACQGLDEPAAASLARHQEWIFSVHETLRSISSSSGRFLIDDKGIVFVLVLGDPGNAHADDIERALSFAGRLERRAQRLGVGIAMGLATGRAFCGVIGNHVRRQDA